MPQKTKKRIKNIMYYDSKRDNEYREKCRQKLNALFIATFDISYPTELFPIIENEGLLIMANSGHNHSLFIGILLFFFKDYICLFVYERTTINPILPQITWEVFYNKLEKYQDFKNLLWP